MKVLTRQFNIYLALAVLVGLTGGCQTDKNKGPTAILRVHIEANPDALGTTQPVNVLRSEPVLVTINREPILSEANLVSARIIDAMGGFAIEIKFDENGTRMLEQYSAINPGRHFVIFGHWGDKASDGRWLANPIISRRNNTGRLVFTADCEREEADQLVAGLNNVVQKRQGNTLK
jgi:hypothetical protein